MTGMLAVLLYPMLSNLESPGSSCCGGIQSSWAHDLLLRCWPPVGLFLHMMAAALPVHTIQGMAAQTLVPAVAASPLWHRSTAAVALLFFMSAHVCHSNCPPPHHTAPLVTH
jgi:hypothetical protein